MRAEDIIWGGNNKCEIKLQHGIGIDAGNTVDISYDHIREKFIMKYGQESSAIEAKGNNERVLEGIYLSGSADIGTLVRVIDADEDTLTYIVEIKVFADIISFNELQGITISVGDDVITRLRKKDQEDPIAYLNSAFKYNDMLFVKGYGRKDADFTILSKYRQIRVKRENGSYTAVRISRYDRNQADYESSLYILKGSVTFVNSTQAAQISKDISTTMDKISEGGTYFDIWNAYNDLDRMFSFKQSTSNGILKYKSVECILSYVFTYVFTLDDMNAEPFPQDTQLACTDDVEITELDSFTSADQLNKIKARSIGTFSGIKDGKCYVVDSVHDSKLNLPEKGFLFCSVAGDAVRLSRREEAQEAIANRTTPLRDLAAIIGNGQGFTKTDLNETPITNMLQRKFTGYVFNEEQRQAIDASINTPDIALILGPPGTGKTTVIKAIIARFDEYYKKHNDNQIPRILVTSFQHEAVENAVIGVEGNGLPSHFQGGKLGDTSRQTANIEEWRDKTIKKIDEEIAELNVDVDDDTKKLRDAVYAWEQKGHDTASGIELLQSIVNKYSSKLSDDLRHESNEIISRANIVSEKKKMPQEWELDERNEILDILNNQRTSPEAYTDDGKRMAYKLKIYIIDGAIDHKDKNGDPDTAFIDDVLNSKGLDEKAMDIYAHEVKTLRGKYSFPFEEKVSLDDISTVQQCLQKVAGELLGQVSVTYENRDSAKAFVLQQYEDGLLDEKEVERIVDKFSNITAATCQQALEVGKNAKKVDFDLVVVDEAARANPLDLLIPMSLGKKIILVGDFLQLPHMLDPDIVKQFEKDQRLNDLGVLKESLFERLYKAFEKKNSEVHRTARLSKQYRMNSVIGNFASDQFYKDYALDSSQINDDEKRANLGMYNEKPMVWLDVSQKRFGAELGGRSKHRPAEATTIIRETRKILQNDPDKKIGMISFYKQQADEIQTDAERLLTEDQMKRIEIGTVDAFQGKEFDVVFLSCTRSNTHPIEDLRHRVGHIQDASRLCVAFTRAKELMIAVGDSATVDCVPQLHAFIDICKEGVNGYYEQVQ